MKERIIQHYEDKIKDCKTIEAVFSITSEIAKHYMFDYYDKEKLIDKCVQWVKDDTNKIIKTNENTNIPIPKHQTSEDSI